MRRAIVIALLVIAAVPASASGASRTYTGNLKTGGTIKFKAKLQSGQPVKIYNLRWKKLPLDCAVGGTAPYSSGYNFPVTVARRQFDARGETASGDVKSKFTGHFVPNGKTAKGYLQVNGSFKAQGFKGCKSGKARFTVK